MSRSFVAASSQYLEYSGAVVSAAPLTMACWFLTPVLGNYALIQPQNSSSINANFNTFRLRTAASGTIFAVAGSAAANSTATTTGNYSFGVWQHACAVFSATDNRAAFVNGGSKGTSAVTQTPLGVNTTWIGAAPALTSNPMNGLIAEAAIWNVALTDEEVVLLASGIVSSSVRPSSLVCYWPLCGNSNPELDIISGFNLTVVGATKGEHPPLVTQSPCVIGFNTSSRLTDGKSF